MFTIPQTIDVILYTCIDTSTVWLVKSAKFTHYWLLLILVTVKWFI